eukprot:scaffold75125_cov72-Phaeocystis_antarctica.AAC.2
MQLCAALATCLAGWAALKSDERLAAPPPPGRPAARTVPQIGRSADGLPAVVARGTVFAVAVAAT